MTSCARGGNVTIWTLAALEQGRLRRDRLFWTVLVLGALALAYGIVNGVAWRDFQQAGIHRATAISAGRLAEAKAKAAELNSGSKEQVDFWSDPRTGIGFEGEYLRLYDCLTPAPLAALAVGQSDLLPYCIRVITGPWPNFQPNYEWENPLRLLLGRFDCSFVVIYLAPLLILLTTFNLLSREREAGTLLLLFSFPVSPRRWLAVTFLLRAAAVLAVILGLPVAGLFLSGFGLAVPGAIIQLAMWLILVSAYCSFWFALAFAVNAFGGTSESNALVLAGCWIVLVILIPASLNLTLKQIYPLPSRVAFLNAVRGASADAERMGSKLLENYLQDHPDLAPGDKKENANDYIETLIAVNAETDRAVDPLKKLFQEQQDRQLALIEKLSLVSPAIVLQQAANLLSGNDQARRLKFMAAVETHRKEVRRFLDPAFVTEAPFTGYDSIPPFKYNDSFFGVKVSRLAGDIATLAGFSLLLAAWGWRALGRPILES